MDSRSSPVWKTLYEAALLELDRTKMLQRIADAEEAVRDRMKRVSSASDGIETQLLLNSLTVLGDLRKMANNGSDH